MTTLRTWVESVAQLTKPDRIHWCDGSEQEYRHLIEQMVSDKTLHPLNQEKYPNCYLHRSHPDDVARTEHLTFICSKQRSEAGPNNNWLEPSAAHEKMDQLFANAMSGRTMYVIPYCMGPMGSPHSRLGVEITDSPYVVINMHLMTRVGNAVLEKIDQGAPFVRGLHSLGDLDPKRRFVMHFPNELLIKSIGSGYGGNALLGKKCHSLRIGSWQAKREGWLAEHMLILGIESPDKKIHYIAAAFPSACGKTNLAMLIPPETYPGWKIWTVGDDIAWIHVGKDGRMYAINPEAGYFGVVPGTSKKTNPNALSMIQKNTIYTNVAVTENMEPWWEGLTKTPPENLTDWQGRPYDPAQGPAAHPNARFTVSSKECPTYTSAAETPEGVPLSAIIFGGRRKELAPLVYEARSWEHGVFMGASAASETTAAATGQVGVVRRDPMAMQPFCGYHFGDYWQHWISFKEKATQLPKIFHVNWFRQDTTGHYLWPGFGDNLRVLEWIIKRCEGDADANSSAIGFLPKENSINLEGIDLTNDIMTQLLSVNPADWRKELAGFSEYLTTFGDHVPDALWQELKAIEKQLGD